MEKVKRDLYDYLMRIPKLTKEHYDRIVLAYGKSLVNETIECMLDEDTVNKFDYYVELQIDEYAEGKSSLQYYMEDVIRRPRASDSSNEKYSREAYEIITELREMFLKFDIKYKKQKWVIFNSILDEIQFYSSMCNDVETLRRFKELSEKFILMKRFGFDGEPLKFREIGQLLGVSKQCVEQEHSRALKKLKKNAYSRLREFIN